MASNANLCSAASEAKGALGASPLPVYLSGILSGKMAFLFSTRG
jgi:hypothetical protein